MSGRTEQDDGATRVAPGEATRKRAAVETYARHEAALRRTARRFSLCADDAEDALQRGLEILLRKAPSDDPRELIRWTQTVVKHEALAIRRERERILGAPSPSESVPEDWIALIPSDSDGPPERAERREAIARSREALRALKPQELRALTLLAEGFSYEEIGARTGWTRTKVNRCLAEGRARFRALISRSEDGSRCAELGPSLSAYCDGEASPEQVSEVRDHLHACLPCRSTIRAYRAAPAAAAAFAPALPLGRSLLDRVQELAASAAARFSGGSADATLTQMASVGGARGAGAAAMAKVAALCLGAVGGAACVAGGVVPVALPLAAEHNDAPARERLVETVAEPIPQPEVEPVAPAPPAPEPQLEEPAPEPAEPAVSTEPATSSGAVEYEEGPAVVEAPAPAPSGGGGGDPAGEFGP